MTVPFHVGSRVFQSPNDPVFLSPTDTSVVALTVPIPTADLPSDKEFDVPFLVNSQQSQLNLPDQLAEEIDTIYDQVATQIVAVLVEEGTTQAETFANMVGNRATMTGVHAIRKAASLGLPRPKIWPLGGYSTPQSPDGIQSVTVLDGGTGYGANTEITVEGNTGGSNATFVPVIGVGGVITAVAVATPGFGYDDPLTFTVTDPDGGGSGANLTGAVGSVLNPIVAEAKGIIDEHYMFAFVDGPDTTDAEAVQARRLIGSKRMGIVDPRILKNIDGIPYPRSGATAFAGVTAARDRLAGPIWPPMNQVVNGIQGINRPMEYPAQSNFINSEDINTFVNLGDFNGAGGLRTWGAYTCADNEAWRFISVVRTTDLVNETVARGLMPFIGRPQLRTVYDEIVMAGRSLLRRMANDEQIYPAFDFIPDATVTEQELAQGIGKLLMYFEAPAPIMDLRTQSFRNVVQGYQTLITTFADGSISIGEAELV